MRIAIVGATGAVGHELLGVLGASSLPVTELRLYASSRSAGRTLAFGGRELSVEVLPEGGLGADLVLASAGGATSRALAGRWIEGGAVVIDNSSAFRMAPDVPLVVPEVNPGAALEHRGLIANPNCTTAIAAVALWPLHLAFGIRRAILSTYQATSGAGARGMEELERETRRELGGEAAASAVFQHPIPFNLIPHVDAFEPNGYTREEMKVVRETRKIFGEPDLAVSCTAVRVPTRRAHAEAITLELVRPAAPEAAREVLAAAPGIELVDDPEGRRYPMPRTASGKWDVEVGRVRSSLAFDGGLDLFVCGDQLLKGAALNAVQVAELLHREGRL